MARRMNKNQRLIKRETPYNLVRLHNHLVFNSSYYLSPVATKVLYYMIAKRFEPDVAINAIPEEDFCPLRELSKAIIEVEKEMEIDAVTKGSNSLYETIDGVLKELSQLQFIFPSDLFINGKPLPTIINVFSNIGGGHGADGERGVVSKFNPDVNILLHQLQRYVLVYRTEINKLTSGHDIKFYQMLRGIINRNKKFGIVYCKETLPLEEVHFLLNTGEFDTYKEFKHFNQLILKKIAKNIIKNTSIHLEITPIRTAPMVEDANGNLKRTRKKTTHIELKFHDTNLVEKIGKQVNLSSDFVPTEDDLAKLTFAETKAYNMLLDFRVKPGIAFRRIIPSIQGSESIGFEDFFVAASLQHFKQHSTNQNTEEMAVKTYVSWWTKHKFFDVGTDVWIKINEQVVTRKKKLSKENATAFVNRTIAKDMTAAEFKSRYWSDNNKKTDHSPTLSDQPKGFASIDEITKKYQT